MPDLANARQRRGLREQPRIARRPRGLIPFALDQILPDLDQHMRQPVCGAVAVHAIIYQAARIRLVVTGSAVRSGPTRRSSRSHKRLVCQGRTRPRQCGVKL